MNENEAGTETQALMRMGTKSEAGNNNLCPAWLTDFHEMLGKKVSGSSSSNIDGVGTSPLPHTNQLNHLSRLIRQPDSTLSIGG